MTKKIENENDFRRNFLMSKFRLKLNENGFDENG